MPLLNSTKQIIELVETLSKRPVHIAEDPTIKTLATMVTARGDGPMHFIRYQPRGSSAPDYFIAYQCGFVVRLFTAPPDKRFDVGSTPEGKRRIDDALLDQRIPREMRGMGDYLLASLITQLRTYPVGLRVDQWIQENYPELTNLQKIGIQTQLDQNVASIRASNGGMFPRKVVKANLSMNAAFALFWSRKWNQESLLGPGRPLVFLTRAKG